MAYIYAAEIWCDDCGEDIRRRLIAEGNAPDDIDDERSYDSGEFPKYCDGEAESDCPEHCAAGDDCLNAYEFDDGVQNSGGW